MICVIYVYYFVLKLTTLQFYYPIKQVVHPKSYAVLTRSLIVSISIELAGKYHCGQEFKKKTCVLVVVL